MKRILIPISFSKSSKNSLSHASSLFSDAHLTLAHIFPSQKFNRLYDFGDSNYQNGILQKLEDFYKKQVSIEKTKASFIALSGIVSDFIAKRSKNYDLLIMTRKPHSLKKHGYLSEKKLYMTTKAKCPVLILPLTKKPFKFETCEHVWHIKRNPSETDQVEKWTKDFSINREVVEEKSLRQKNFISSFWQNIVKYENTHNSKLLNVIDEAHESEPIDLIILVDNDRSLFTKFFMSDTVKLFCKYDIPLLILPPSK